MRFIDLFCGIGGIRLAFERAGSYCVFSSDSDKYAQLTYKENFNETPFGDIKKINVKNIPSFDILTAGFPCQPFSYSGKLEGFKDETRGTLFFDIVRILEYHKPKMFLLENVKGIKSHDQGKTLDTIYRKLAGLGYTVHWKILDSLDYGLPQKRERWYCVGFDENIVFNFPRKGSLRSKLRDIIDLDNNDPNLKLADKEIARINFHFSSKDIRVKHDSSEHNPTSKIGRHGMYSFQKNDGCLRFHIGDVAKTQIQDAFYACLDSYAPTIIANRVPKLWDIQRKLSVREAARLQGFPDNFVFPVSDHQAYKQLGNSVAVPVVEEIAKNMISAYSNKQRILQLDLT